MTHPLMIKSLRCYFLAISSVLPRLATRSAYKLFHKPVPYAIRNSEQKLLEKAQHFNIRLDKDSLLKAYRWGDVDAPAILLVHGWSAHAAVMGLYIRSLVKAGYQVISYDAIGHGKSRGGVSDLANWANSVNVVMSRIGAVECIIAHSMGGGAVVIASNLGLDTKRLVLIAPMNDAIKVTDRFGHYMGIPHKVREAMRDYTWQQNKKRLTRFGTDWEDVFRSDFQVPTLVIHDQNDRITELSDSKRLVSSWPWARLLVTKGLGHKKILFSRDVFNEVLGFIQKDEP